MRNIVADPVYNPNFKLVIDSNTKLGPHASMATFLGSYGNRTSIDYIVDQQTRHDIARQLYLHAEIINSFHSAPDFNDYRLVVAESIYYPAQDEDYPQINALKQSGRCVAYHLVDKGGSMANDKIFDLALFWKDYIVYDHLDLAYDSYNPDNTLSSSILITMPVVSQDFTIDNFAQAVTTSYNGNVITKDGLQEILP